MIELHILGILLAVTAGGESFSLGTDCDCSQLQKEVETAKHNQDAQKACQLMNERKFCLKNKEQSDFTCSHIEDRICEIDRDPLYYACDKIPFTCNKSIGVCLSPDLVNKLHGFLPAENCPTIRKFLQCEAINQVPGSKFSILYKTADMLCTALNDSIYTACTEFMVCYKKLFNHGNDLMKIQNHHWWCTQLKEAMKCSGITVDFSDVTTDVSDCLIPGLNKDENFCLHDNHSAGKATWTTYTVAGCIVITVLLLVLIAVVVVGVLRRKRRTRQFVRPCGHYQDIQSVRLRNLDYEQHENGVD